MAVEKGLGKSFAAAVHKDSSKTGREVEAEEAGKASMRLLSRHADCVASPAEPAPAISRWSVGESGCELVHSGSFQSSSALVHVCLVKAKGALLKDSCT